MAALAHQHHVGPQCNQQWHGVPDRGAIGHIAAQGAAVAHGQARKAGGEVFELRAVGHQGGEGVGQGDCRANGDVMRVPLHPPQLGHAGHVQQLIKAPVLLGNPQAHVGAARHDLGSRVGGAPRQQLAQAGRGHVGGIYFRFFN